jgi:GcrA cell cycle regulator
MRNNVSSAWTDHRTDALKGLWAAGLSGTEIAASMGVTRCAVLGKVFRLGLGGRDCDSNRSYSRRTPEQIQATKREKEGRRRERRRAHRLTVVKPAINLEALRCVEVEPLHKSFADLGRNDCRWAYGDNAPYTFCGNPQREGHSYCGPHFALTLRRGWGS